MGRIVRGADGELLAIREERDCTEDEREIDEINAGFYCFDAGKLQGVLGQLSDDNAQGELYLTDAVGHLIAAGDTVETVLTEDAEETIGVNSLAELSVVRQIHQERILIEHMANGVIIDDPSTTFIDHGVAIGSDSRILPCTVIGYRRQGRSRLCGWAVCPSSSSDRAL